MAAPILTAITLLTNAFMVVVAGIVGYMPFFGAPVETPDDAHEAPAPMWVAPLLLAMLGVVVGILPNPTAGIVVSPAVAAVLAQPVSVKLALLHGLTIQLVLSSITFILGVTAYFGRDTIARVISRLDLGVVAGPEQLYQWMLDFMTFVARIQTRILQNGHLHFYLLTIILTTTGVVGWSLWNQKMAFTLDGWWDIRFYEWLISFVIMLAVAIVVRASSRFLAIVGLGVIGYSIALIFIIYGAPDLAMTQFSIDTLTVVLLVLVLYRMPRYVRYSKIPERMRDGLAALAAGGIMTALALCAMVAPAHSRLSPYFAENSYALAKGRNIVNVILVDFRALDTMGEITVLAVAAIGVFSLLKLWMREEEE